MSKRPSILGELKLAPTAPAKAVPPAKAAPTRKERPDVIHTSIYLPKPVYLKLREIAYVTDQKIHDVIMEGVDAALKQYGHPSVAELKAAKG
ncbi:hypothetical protein SLNSH_05145 [Alsobacter soli]|uniref:Uncharacterized protein n=1 Tax=Alsobacter soli TaxID=2109933 RepID=A0A2T1HWW6_9HYPH|nr:hypothetical protein [Alsobacter soli]PSC06187.1 hypothetical protein SLNSH_05145 [Alsobacter soli]